MKKPKLAGLTLFPCAMLIISAIDSIRNLPATALFGSSLVFYLLLAALMFLIPCGLVAAELASFMPEKGGIYYWVSKAFNTKTGFIAVWLQWINTMVWYPTILSFIAGTLAYIIDPTLAQNKYYLVAVILIVFWSLTLINIKGVHTSARFASFCGIIGMVIPMILMIAAGCAWVFTGKPVAIHLTWSAFIPKLSEGQSWISLTAILASFLGMELTSVHAAHMENPKKNFPLALLIAVPVIIVTMLFGSLAIAVIIPQEQIGLVNGVMQVFQMFLEAFHMGNFLPVLTIMILLGSLGNMVNWLISPAKGLFHAGEDGYLPKRLTTLNRHHAPVAIMLLQAVLVSLICIVFLFMPTVNSSYWLLTDLSTQLYMLMYLIMFVSAVVIKMKHRGKAHSGFQIKGGVFGTALVCLIGFIGSFISIIIGFFPPQGINVGNIWHYELIFGVGMGAMILPVLGFFYYSKISLIKS